MSDKQYLTEKEQKFVENKALGKTGAESVRLAGYGVTTPQSAKSLGYNLMQKPIIAQKIQELRKAQSKKLIEHLPDLLQKMLDLALGKTKGPSDKSVEGTRIQFEAVRDLLDRIPGMGKKEKVSYSEEDFPADVLRVLNRFMNDEGEA